MPNHKIFCNTPWFEANIYWDGSLGICCQESHKLYEEGDQKYNIKNMTLLEWFNSEPVKQFRRIMLGDQKLSECTRCYLEEDSNGNSRRIKSNLKSVIFTRTAFDDSFVQSPGHQHFEFSRSNHGLSKTMPIDLHIDLGNYCNLACKMCGPHASTTIASQQVVWGIESSGKYLRSDWTKNKEVWERFKKEIIEIPGLRNIHFMGGETLLTPRMEEIIDHMIAHKKFDMGFSFVTNGTVFRPSLIEKLKLFSRTGLEISLETLTKHNVYQRQGSDMEVVLQNIQKYNKWCDGTSITVTLRPAITALTIGHYDSLLKYALENNFVIKSSLCYNPYFLHPCILPLEVRLSYRKKYAQLLDILTDVDNTGDYNSSDIGNVKKIIKDQAVMCMDILSLPDPEHADTLRQQLVQHCRRWDEVYGLDAIDYYPELEDMLIRHGY